jgi:hypothetical protein
VNAIEEEDQSRLYSGYLPIKDSISQVPGDPGGPRSLQVMMMKGALKREVLLSR